MLNTTQPAPPLISPYQHVINGLFSYAVAVLLGGWMLALLSGIVHRYMPAWPLLGYWESGTICMLVQVLKNSLMSYDQERAERSRQWAAARKAAGKP